jgi:hypothetical protein
MRNLILGLSLSVAFIVGCLAGPAVRPNVVGTAHANKNRPKWEYTCFQYDFHDERVDGIDGGKIKKQSNKAGQFGWEMVSGIIWNDVTIWCFKRRQL